MDTCTCMLISRTEGRGGGPFAHKGFVEGEGMPEEKGELVLAAERRDGEGQVGALRGQARREEAGEASDQEVKRVRTGERGEEPAKLGSLLAGVTAAVASWRGGGGGGSVVGSREHDECELHS